MALAAAQTPRQYREEWLLNFTSFTPPLTIVCLGISNFNAMKRLPRRILRTAADTHSWSTSGTVTTCWKSVCMYTDDFFNFSQQTLISSCVLGLHTLAMVPETPSHR